MKKILAFLVMIGFAATLGAQSVVELARREKERRGKMGRQTPVVTNIDLLRLDKKAAMETGRPATEAAEVEGQEEGEAGEAESVPPTGTEQPAAPPAAGPEAQAAPPAETGPSLEDQLSAAEDKVDLLTTKIHALKQAYSAQENMVPNYVIEQQLTETLERLQEAEAQTARLRNEIAQKGPQRKTPAAALN